MEVLVTSVEHKATGRRDRRKDLSALDFIIVAWSVVLIFFSLFYARERVIFGDTATYLFEMTRSKHFVIPTNRFISILSQPLPLAGIRLGLPLRVLMVLYSLNLILIPLLCVAVIRFLFKRIYLALAILLFYTVMGSNLFYYPVSEFQMGLCLLLVYHGLLLAFKENRVHHLLYYPVAVLLLVFITFSHPMCLPVLIAWLLWLILAEPSVKIRDLFFPLCIVLLSYFIKEHYFKAMVGNLAFDDSRAEGLKNFGGPLAGYFDSSMALSSLNSIWGDHFIAVFFLLLSLLYLGWQKKWLTAIILTGICFGFWLLVSVTFKDKIYDHYYEHLYQPLPFFVSLAFTSYGIKLFGPKYIRTVLLGIAVIVAIAKVNNGHEDNANRQAWFGHYLSLMNKLHLKKMAIEHSAIQYGSRDSYWSAPAESLLLSSLNGPQYSRTLFVATGCKALQKQINQTKYLVLGVDFLEPIHTLNPCYFMLDEDKPYVIMDSLTIPGAGGGLVTRK